MGWIECKARDLVIGDAVLLTRRVEIKQENGRYAQGTVRQKDKATGTWSDAKGRQKVEWKHTARVLDILANAGDPAVVIERIDDHPPKEAGAVRPLAVEQIPFRVLDWPSMKLRRNTDHGPTPRTNSHGRFFLLQMIRNAARGDETDEQAIGRLALCVRRGDIDDAETSGSLPVRIGRSNAIGMLKDERLFSEAAVRQLDGRMSLPESRDVPDLGHEGLGTSPSRSRTDSTFPDPDDGRRMMIIGKRIGYVQPADPSDPEVAEILAGMPGAEVRILTYPTADDMIRLRRHFGPKGSEAAGEAPESVGSDADGEEGVNHADTSGDE